MCSRQSSLDRRGISRATIIPRKAHFLENSSQQELAPIAQIWLMNCHFSGIEVAISSPIIFIRLSYSAAHFNHTNAPMTATTGNRPTDRSRIIIVSTNWVWLFLNLTGFIISRPTSVDARIHTVYPVERAYTFSLVLYLYVLQDTKLIGIATNS